MLYARKASLEEMVTRPVARFQYSKELAQWSLQHFDDEERWRPYLNAGPSLNLAQLVVHVEQDPLGFFRGDSLHCLNFHLFQNVRLDLRGKGIRIDRYCQFKMVR